MTRDPAVNDCSVMASFEPLPGSAPSTRGWLVVEHPGPYGRVAADSLGDELRSACLDAGYTLVLARRPRSQGQAAWIASGGDMFSWSHIDPEKFLDWDWCTLDSPTLPRGATREQSPILFVCTNGKRDACCARYGRPVASELMSQGLPVWECSHLGGHRFAPTALLLPFGSVHGRLTTPMARTLLEGAHAGRCDVTTLRGVSYLSAVQQVADIAVRQSEGIHALVHLHVEPDPVHPTTVVVRHPDGRAWEVDVLSESGTTRRESCGKDPVASQWWSAVAVRAAS